MPIVGMTASLAAGGRQRCIEAGMSGQLCKPLDPAILVQWLAGTNAVEAALPAGKAS